MKSHIAGRRPVRLLGALAILALALLALAAAWAWWPAVQSSHAQEQTTIWSATLTVDVYRYFHGCDNGVPPELDDCSTALSDDEFTYEGVTYTVRTLFWDPGWDPGMGELQMWFTSTVEGVQGKAALGSLTLNVDGVAFAVKDAYWDGDLEGVWQFDPDPDWTDGQKVSLSLTEPTPTPTPTPEPTPTPTPEPTPASGDSASAGEGTDTTTTSPSGDSTPDPLAPTISGTAQVGQTLTASVQLPS